MVLLGEISTVYLKRAALAQTQKPFRYPHFIIYQGGSNLGPYGYKPRNESM